MTTRSCPKAHLILWFYALTSPQASEFRCLVHITLIGSKIMLNVYRHSIYKLIDWERGGWGEENVIQNKKSQNEENMNTLIKEAVP